MRNRHFYAILFMILNVSFLSAQKFADNKAEYDSIYNNNIKLSKINNVYIPSDIDDAHKRLLKLTPTEALRKFKDGPEVEVCKKLHFGIGKWMIVNWNFYEGSRLSHNLKSKGVLHPDDMANFILRTLHRNLNKVEVNEKEIIETLAVNRKKEAKIMLGQ